MTKNQVMAELRRLGWHRKNWRWFKPSHPVGKRGVMLRDAASFELLESNENLFEQPRFKRGTAYWGGAIARPE